MTQSHPEISRGLSKFQLPSSSESGVVFFSTESWSRKKQSPSALLGALWATVLGTVTIHRRYAGRGRMHGGGNKLFLFKNRVMGPKQ